MDKKYSFYKIKKKPHQYDDDDYEKTSKNKKNRHKKKIKYCDEFD